MPCTLRDILNFSRPPWGCWRFRPHNPDRPHESSEAARSRSGRPDPESWSPRHRSGIPNWNQMLFFPGRTSSPDPVRHNSRNLSESSFYKYPASTGFHPLPDRWSDSPSDHRSEGSRPRWSHNSSDTAFPEDHWYCRKMLHRRYRHPSVLPPGHRTPARSPEPLRLWHPADRDGTT